MTGPGGIAPVQARIASIQARIESLVPVDAGSAIAPATGVAGEFGGEFATLLAQAGATGGGPVSAKWSIPWLDGTAPAAPSRASATRFGISAVGASDGSANSGDPLAVVSPLDGRISQPYGPTTSKYSAPMTVDGVHYAHFHDGIDIAAPLGRDVHAMAAGTVEFAGRYPDGAQVVRVRHADGSVSLYAHLGRDLSVRKGDKVAAGEKLGEVGMTGNTTGPHLHLELYRNGKPTDPQDAIDRGRLPGTLTDASVLPASVADASSAGSVSSAEALARFDRVADEIPYATEIRAAAVRAGIDPLLLASLVGAESSFHPTSVSSCGAMGLCQLMPATAKALHVKDPFDPAQNLRGGAKYLANNLKLYGRVDLALAAYQAGKGAVARAGGIPDSPTTHHYIDRILRSWAGYMEGAA